MTATDVGYVTRAVVFTVDPSPAQDRMLRNYCGAARFAYNWARKTIGDNLTVRAVERAAGVPEDRLTLSQSWSKYALRTQFNQAKADVAPWSGEVAKHCFDTGISQAADAFKNWSASKKLSLIHI